MIDRPTGNTIAEAAFLMGDPARANMLAALMSGEALTAGELAAHAGVTAQTASGHLSRLTEGGLVAVERQGRHRYVRLSSPAVAQALEGLMALSGHTATQPQRPRGPRNEAMRLARSYYDHLAGRPGVAVADAMQRRDLVRLEDGVGLVTDEGQRFLADFGIGVAGLSKGRRPLCRSCLDWSERRPHIAGAVGRALLDHSIDKLWLRTVAGSRAVIVTPLGRRTLTSLFELEPDIWEDAA